MVPILATMASLALAAPALAFDTGPHAEITKDAMSAEGFGEDAIGVTQVNNWFCDFYEQASSNPFSGHGGFFKRLLSGAVTAEQWPDAVVDAAWRCHFDNAFWLSNTVAISAEWDRLRRAVWALAQEARERNDPAELLAVLGISLHQLQDFYTHSNWVEARPGHGIAGSDGPGWQERGYGSYPTWFDLPANVRETSTIYADESQGHRLHGFWNSDGNNAIDTMMNKDWSGRPYYTPAAISAYFATRQWIEAVRAWVGDNAFWRRAQRFRANQEQLDHDLSGMYNISLSAGHWQGQGEPLGGEERGPGGNLLDLRSAIKDYFQETFDSMRGRTDYRSRFQGLVKRVEDPSPSGRLAPVPSSQRLQSSTRLVVLRILSYRGEGLGDPGPDEADVYARVGIDGQQMTSAMINGNDGFSFSRPNSPFTWFKAVPAEPNESEPVESIEVEVDTADTRWAGTDDDVFLRLGRRGQENFHFQLDKNFTNDFEQGDRDTYSVPIDGAIRDGMTVGDISRVQLEKTPDGVAGGWKLGGMTLRVNGKPFYEDQNINQWLEDGRRIWQAPDFKPRNPRGAEVPVWLNLRESDSIYGSDDEGDVNPFDNRDIVGIGYQLGKPLQASAHGGKVLGGRQGYGGDDASLTYKLETIVPETLPGPPEPSGNPGERATKPDLVVSAFLLNRITIQNRGDGDAGPFRLKVAAGAFQYPGLPAGASFTRPLSLSCSGTFFAMVDDLEQVEETDETNNSKAIEPGLC
jgi:PLAT/LH2 domain-containing protein